MLQELEVGSSPTNTPLPVETRDICRQFSDQSSTHIANTDFRNAAELRAEFDVINNNLEAKASTANQVIEDEVIPLLTKMQALLSQRGGERLQPLFIEAKLPTWTEYYNTFRQKVGLKTLRTFQRKLAAKHVGPEQQRSNRAKRRQLTTGKVDLVAMLSRVKDHLDLIDKMRDNIPEPVLKSCDALRSDFGLGLQKPAPKSSDESLEKQRTAVDKVVKKTLARKHNGGLFSRLEQHRTLSAQSV